MRPRPSSNNIDDYLEYFVWSLGRGLTDGGREILRQMLYEQRGHPRSVFLYVDQRRQSSQPTDPELDQALTDFYSTFC
jgi:hypothetical protein